MTLTIDNILNAISVQLSLTAEEEWEVLEEIRTHLEEAVEKAKLAGTDESVALLKAAEEFGVDDVGAALQEVHAGWDSAEAILLCIVPVFCTIVLRWTIFSADGTAGGWQMIVNRPIISLIGLTTLIIPVVLFRHYRFAVVGWLFFWLISFMLMLAKA